MNSKNISALVLLTGLIAGSQALAHEAPELGAPRGLAAVPASNDTGGPSSGGTSVATADESAPRTLRTTLLSVSPQAGIMGYTNGSGEYIARGAAGLEVDGNVGRLALGALTDDFYLGLASGVFYSHLGTSSSSNFFGNASDDPSNIQTDLMVVPTNVKIGYHISDSVRVSAHGGGNLIYTSAEGKVNFSQGTWDEGAKWNYFPNAGADLEVGIAKNVSLVARPDFTFFTTGETLFTGTLGLNVSML